MIYRTFVYLLLGILVCSADSAFAEAAGRVVYVDVAAEGLGDGTSWADGYTDLQDALDDVELTGDCLPNSPCEIWVAAGTYFPSRRTDPTDPTSATFSLMNNVGIYGGFGGWETERRQRNIDLNETIFNGDHNQDDDSALEPTSNCCVQRPGEGGCDDPVCEQIVLEQVNFWPCDSDWGDFCASAARVVCCEICRPSYCDNSGPIILAEGVDATSVLDGVTVRSSEGIKRLSGLWAEDSDLTVRNSTFTDNFALAVNVRSGDPVFENCSFLRNRGTGADVRNLFAEPSVEPSFVNCDFVENEGLGLVYLSSKLISGCRFIRNSDTALLLGNGAPNILHCLFLENAQGISAGGFPLIANCGFFGNGDGISKSTGGASVKNALFANCVFGGNVGSKYGALNVDSFYSTLVLNCTFANNIGRIGGALGAFGVVEIENSIFWNNMTDSEIGAGIFYFENPLYINYSVLQNWTPPLQGNGNVDLDPLFVDLDGPDNIVGTEDDNLRLSTFSPLIDLGDPDPPLAPFMDADGHVRILRGRIDMGAYEFGIGDYDEDRFCTLFDFAAWDACMTGPDEYPFQLGCEAFDFKAELTDHIDLLDFAGFQRAGCGP